MIKKKEEEFESLPIPKRKKQDMSRSVCTSRVQGENSAFRTLQLVLDPFEKYPVESVNMIDVKSQPPMTCDFPVWWPTRSQPSRMYICGKAGCGKTTLMLTLLQSGLWDSKPIPFNTCFIVTSKYQKGARSQLPTVKSGY